jgi:hypothetical protein
VVDRLAALALAFLALLAAAPAAVAGAQAVQPIDFIINTQTIETSVSVPVFNQSVSMAANSTYTINITLPSGWTASDVKDVVLYATGVTGSISLAAKDASGAVLATGTIVPLSSGYTQTLPPNTSTIELSASEAANATIIVYVDSQPVSFVLSFDKSELHVVMGEDAWLHGSIKQVEGPAGYVYFTWDIPSPLNGGVYWTQSTANPADVNNPTQTSGAGWYTDVYLHIDASQVTQESNFNVVVHAFYDPDGPSGGAGSTLVATVQLSSVYSDTSTTTTSNGNAWHLGNIDAKTAGLGIIIVFLLILLAASGGGRHHRRGMAELGAALFLFLLLIAIAAFVAGFTDVKFSINPAALGVGVVAVLLLLLLAKHGIAKPKLPH